MEGHGKGMEAANSLQDLCTPHRLTLMMLICSTAAYAEHIYMTTGKTCDRENVPKANKLVPCHQGMAAKVASQLLDYNWMFSYVSCGKKSGSTGNQCSHHCVHLFVSMCMPADLRHCILTQSIFHPQHVCLAFRCWHVMGDATRLI
jgi:hypothetical protein